MKSVRIGGRECRLEGCGGGPLLLFGAGEGESPAERLAARAPEKRWALLTYGVADWNRGFSPWPAPAAFGKEPFAGQGSETLAWLAEACLPWAERELGPGKRYAGGYSLAGLFSLWALCECPALDGAASCSGSLWFPGWGAYRAAHPAEAGQRVYLSLGVREEHTRNRMLAAVGDATRREAERLRASGAVSCLEWNPGGHFDDPTGRMARGFAWLLEGEE